MSSIGQKEQKTQQRVVRLFHEKPGYNHLGNWEERDANRDANRSLTTGFLLPCAAHDTAGFVRY